MSDLKTASIQELEAELERRKRLEKDQRPQPLQNINWQPLIDYVKEGVDHVNEYGKQTNDFDHHVFETVMEAVYGSNIWKWWIAHLRQGKNDL